jgi:DNA helicase-2/ATP-dependent DNA helicase PcrA
MKYIADLHVHSHYAYATSKNLNLESIYTWANVKGINVVGTGDFTHPKWFAELQEKLRPDGYGFFELKNTPDLLNSKVSYFRFCLTSEVCTIHKDCDRVRKNHILLYAPDFESVARLNAKLQNIVNLSSDGRPVLKLSPRDLLEVILSISDRMHVIPAHVWTPWFSTLGSKSGYDNVNECFKDLSSYIFALETGLSADPAMSRRLSSLDRYTMVSNSDAHSPQNLGREANLFNTECSYDALFAALKTKKGFLGTLEFFPQKGKYYLDGHRNCGICFNPANTLVHKSICPVCGKKLTIGVLNRVESLADKHEESNKICNETTYIIPLPEIISQIMKLGVASKAVQKKYFDIVGLFENEFYFLHQARLEDIENKLGRIYAEAIRRLREQSISINPGYDGLYGTINIFSPDELQSFL